MQARAWLRAGLILLALLNGIQGLWAYLSPHSFYNDVPTVSMYTPFSEHFVSDFGGLQLAMTVVVGAAAVLMERRLTFVALAAFLVYMVTHLIFHLTHLIGMTGGYLALNTVGLGLVPAIPVALLIVAVRIGPAGWAGTARQPGEAGQRGR
jgi:hypothetical protein